ncbi:phosphoribosylglycinamide formyltransferase [Candidatus Dependentiae bacterium]|nr:phosphoribosylglycinamide formyltransferase [Candidatus Dependentiae bacterium]
MRKKFKLAVLVSGQGSNLQALIDNIKLGKLKTRIEVVLSDNFKANAINIALENNIPAVSLERSGFSSRKEFEGKMLKILEGYTPDLIVLAGFMRVLSKNFIKTFPRKIINIHPALLPAFPGLDSQNQALEYGVKISGATVHFVDEGVDTGPIIIQKAVRVKDNDSRDSLAARILKLEHKILTEAIELIRKEKIIITGRQVKYKK